VQVNRMLAAVSRIGTTRMKESAKYNCNIVPILCHCNCAIVAEGEWKVPKPNTKCHMPLSLIIN
jgi:hypothetical protein